MIFVVAKRDSQVSSLFHTHTLPSDSANLSCSYGAWLPKKCCIVFLYFLKLLTLHLQFRTLHYELKITQKRSRRWRNAWPWWRVIWQQHNFWWHVSFVTRHRAVTYAQVDTKTVWHHLPAHISSTAYRQWQTQPNQARGPWTAPSNPACHPTAPTSLVPKKILGLL